MSFHIKRLYQIKNILSTKQNIILLLVVILSTGLLYIATEDTTSAIISTIETPVEAPISPVIAPVSEVIAEVEAEPTKEDLMLKCSCVTYMRERGHEFPPIPDPSYLEPNSTPVKGGLVLFDFGGWAHIGEIIDMRPGVALIHHRYLRGTECITTTGAVEWTDVKGVYLDPS